MKRDEQSLIYDPDPLAILTIIVGAIGSLGGVVSTISFFQKQREKNSLVKYDKEKIKLAGKSIMDSMNRIDSAASRIQVQMFSLREILFQQGENQQHKIRPAFGENTLILSKAHFNYFLAQQNDIIRNVEAFLIEVSALEELLSLNYEWCETYDAIKLKHQIRRILLKANHFIDGHERKSIYSFFREVDDLCNSISSIFDTEVKFFNWDE